MNASATDKINMAVNLNSGEEKPPKRHLILKMVILITSVINVTTYDSLGNEHNLNLFFVKPMTMNGKFMGKIPQLKQQVVRQLLIKI